MTQVILKQLTIFPSVTKDQLFRLVKSYRGCTSIEKFNIELKFLVNKGLVSTLITDTSFKYTLK